ncbi:MAG: ABC transporter permease [Clostridia bacterium]|nr:ABC transporter permease [Clostridia bacterium]
MKTVLRLSFAYIRKGIKQAILTLISVALSFTLTAMVCWLCGALLEDSRGDPTAYKDALGFTVLFLSISFVLCFLIVNGIFSITSARRIKFMGMLTSVGASKAQKYGVLLTESFIYAVLGGATGTAGAILILNALYSKLYTSAGASLGFSQVFTVNRTLIAIGIGVTLVSVFVAVTKAARLLVRISPVEAMKEQEKISVSLHRGRFAGMAEKVFGFYGRLAGSMYENHKSKYRAISLSLSCGTVFYMTCFCLSVYYPLKMRPNKTLNGLTTAFMLLAAVFVVLFLLSSLSSASINFDRRKREFSMLKSIGMTNRELCKLVLVESVYLIYFSALYGLIGSLIGDLFAFLIIWGGAGSSIRFGFPIKVYLVFIAAEMAICAVFSVYNIIRISRINIVEHIKSE